jgi:hypothetical protein
MKTCSWCGVLKQFIFFSKNKNSTDGYNHMCDACRKLKEWRKPSKKGV